MRRPSERQKPRHAISAFFAPWLDPFLNPVACLPSPPEKPVLPTEPNALLNQLELILRRRLAALNPGERPSLFRGQGLDFAELREYHPGDDLRKMDWNVLARTLTPHVREYHADQQQTWWLIVDCTPSMFFGRERRKIELALELTALLGLVAHKNGHLLGGALMRPRLLNDVSRSGTCEPALEIIPPRSGRSSLQQLLSRIMQLTGDLDGVSNSSVAFGSADPLSLACQQLGAFVSKTSTVFFLSDFLAWPLTGCKETLSGKQNTGQARDWQISLGQLSQKAQLVSIPISDPVELMMPADVGILPVTDLETGEAVVLDTTNPEFLANYVQLISNLQKKRNEWLAKIGQVIPASTAQSALDNLVAKSGQALFSQGRWPARGLF